MTATGHRLWVAAGCAVMLLAGCAGGDDDGGGEGGERRSPPPRDVRHGGTLTMLWNDDVDSIDPGVTYSSSGYIITRATQRPLLSFEPDDATNPVPDLASGAPEVSRGVVTVRLRKGVRFSPPVRREVRSDDVKYAVERGFFRTVNSPYAGVYFGDIEGAEVGVPPGRRIAGIETPDVRTVVFRLSHGTGGGLARALVMTLTAPVPREYALPDDRRNPSAYGQHQVATGPYMLRSDARGRVVGYEPGKRIHLVRNPSWRRATDFKPAYVDEIDVREGFEDAVATGRRVLQGSGLVTGDTPAPRLSSSRCWRMLATSSRCRWSTAGAG